MTDRTSAIAAAIRAELRLLDPAVRASPALLAELLHPEFREFGSSGREWTRDAIIAALTAPGGPAPRPITTSKMRGVQLAPDVVHLTYDTETDGRRAHRSSLWRLTGDTWLLHFHQGTPYGC
ncbi:nuclear transport factor 2 family protein [Streptomyces sp. NPDC101062]|uniref:nuclear transport factor 2 family protein n=1 Tax=unclassified Streptomyces TaxID=2593676 RepID=UPI002E78DB70|nr:nuclear transport factor 2 family protein [Streptomyces sp. JV176]MEE1797730.1 nuclear transport factor 2 family protein [Streptomyces sp. JV176]